MQDDFLTRQTILDGSCSPGVWVGNKHGPNRLSSYIEIHDTVMRSLFDEGCVESESLEFTSGADGWIILDGEIVLRGRLLKVKVTKGLEVRDNGQDDPMVQTRYYSYNVSIVGGSNVFRYCSPHKDPGPEHHDVHHRHQYDPFGPNPYQNTVSTVEEDTWPLLSEVIREADEWYWANQEEINAMFGQPFVDGSN